MSAVNVRICHDDNLVVTGFCNIKLFPNTSTECSDHGANFVIRQNLIKARFFYVKDLTT